MDFGIICPELSCVLEAGASSKCAEPHSKNECGASVPVSSSHLRASAQRNQKPDFVWNAVRKNTSEPSLFRRTNTTIVSDTGNLAPDLCIIEMMRQVNIRLLLLLLLYMKLR